nr:RNA-directed DNA polymerase, eukaryota [Tanacetum cinerariifolium]
MFKSECSNDVLKDISKDTKCLMALIKLIQVFVRRVILTSGYCPRTSTKVGGNISWVQTWTEVVDKVKSLLSNWKMKSLSIGVDTMTLWIKCVPIKVNVLAWKIKIEALPTRFNISRRGIDIDSILCPICECGVESARLVFFSCSLMNSLRLKSKSKLMIECVFYVVWWHVWTFPNKLLFEDKKPSKAIIFDDVVF